MKCKSNLRGHATHKKNGTKKISFSRNAKSNNTAKYTKRSSVLLRGQQGIKEREEEKSESESSEFKI